jgi:hypothetical protein
LLTALTRNALRARALSGKRAWAAIAAFVLYHDLACSEGEMLSESVDRGLERHPSLVYGFIGVTAAHLLNLLPDRVDPYQLVGLNLRKIMKGN